MSFKTKTPAIMITGVAVLSGIGLAAPVGICAGFVLALCGASAFVVVALLMIFAMLGAWLGVRATVPARDRVPVAGFIRVF